MAAFWLLDLNRIDVTSIPRPRFERELSDPESYFGVGSSVALGGWCGEISKKPGETSVFLFSTVALGCSRWRRVAARVAARVDFRTGRKFSRKFLRRLSAVIFRRSDFIRRRSAAWSFWRISRRIKIDCGPDFLGYCGSRSMWFLVALSGSRLRFSEGWGVVIMASVIEEVSGVEAKGGGSVVDVAGSIPGLSFEAKPAADWSASDRAFGYPFGCDGLAKIGDARAELGGVSRYTIYRLVRKGKIRAGTVEGATVYCLHSIWRYRKSREK